MTYPTPLGRAAAGLLAFLVIIGAGRAVAQTSSLEAIAELPHAEQLQALEKHLDANGESVETLLALGDWLAKENRLELAKARYQRALELDPASLPALVRLSVVMESSGQGEESLALFEKYVEAHPADPRAMAFYGESLWKMDRRPAAVGWYRKALELDPDCVEARFNLGVAFADLGIFREAIAEWERVVEIGGPEEMISLARDNIREAKERL